jgi:hypothetical protein
MNKIVSVSVSEVARPVPDLDINQMAQYLTLLNEHKLLSPEFSTAYIKLKTSIGYAVTTDRFSTRATIVLTILLAGLPESDLLPDTKDTIRRTFSTEIHSDYLSSKDKSAITAAFTKADLSRHFQTILTH